MASGHLAALAGHKEHPMVFEEIRIQTSPVLVNAEPMIKPWSSFPPGTPNVPRTEVTAPCSEVALPLLLAATVQGKCQGRSLTGLTLDSADEEKASWSASICGWSASICSARRWKTGHREAGDDDLDDFRSTTGSEEDIADLVGISSDDEI